jgi:hypothetical protein
MEGQTERGSDEWKDKKIDGQKYSDADRQTDRIGE